jgi:glycosyltransferase involved in cell wall biosynthesis
VDLLLAAWPLVVERVPEARLVVVGFGTYREGLERLLEALAEGDLDAAREVAARGRELEGGPAGGLRHLAAFLDGLDGERREAYAVSARTAAKRVQFTGRLEHDDLPPLLALSEAQVVPSTFPEAFGMVAAEAAASGCPPVVARHSGLAEVAEELEAAYGERYLALASFAQGDSVELQEKLHDLLALPAAERRELGAAARRLAVDRWSWESVAQRLLEPFE